NHSGCLQDRERSTPTRARSATHLNAYAVICLALLIFCLIERQVRLAIAPHTTLDSLYVGRPAKPTGRLIFEALARLRLIPAINGQPPGIPQPPPLQATLLDLLKVDPTRPR
ncbi:MAG: hypothetical protein ACRDRG_04630, partial [Pseudonocardiaceae bacterium]